MTQEYRTENDKLRRRLFNRARSQTTTHLRQKYPRRWRGILQETREAFPGLAWANVYKRAETRLRQEFREEYSLRRMVLQHNMELEVGYEPAPTGGHFTGVHAKPPGHPARVDFDARVQQDAS